MILESYFAFWGGSMSQINSLGNYTNSRYLYGISATTDSQSYFDNRTSNTSNPSVINLLSQSQNLSSQGQSLTEQLSSLVRLTRYAMDAMGLSSDSRVTFSKLQDYCDQVKESFSSAVKEGLGKAKADLSASVFSLNSYGALKVQSATPLNAALTELALDNNGSLVKELSLKINQSGADLSQGLNFTLSNEGKITVLGERDDVQKILDEKNITAASLAAKICAQSIDPNLDFSLKTLEDDSLSVNCANSSFTKVLEAFFDENPSIVKDFQRSEALAGIEDAREFLAISPSEMRTRLQLESMVAWWDSSNYSSNSSFGTYSSGTYSRLNGINVSV